MFFPHLVGNACTRNRHRHVHTIETRTAHTAARHLTVERHVCVMTDQDHSLDWRLTKGIRRCLALFVDIGTIIGIIAIMLPVLIVMWAAGREARVAWAAS